MNILEKSPQQKNPFETGMRKVIPAVLVYLRYQDSVLMIHRNLVAQDGRVDFHHGKWNGLGGKLEADESPYEAVIREIQEESGLKVDLSQLKALGTLQFPNFKAHRNEDWIVFVYCAELNDQQFQSPLKNGDEGSLHWVPLSNLFELNLWPGDHLFLPYVMKVEPFMGTIWYHESLVQRHFIQKL